MRHKRYFKFTKWKSPAKFIALSYNYYAKAFVKGFEDLGTKVANKIKQTPKNVLLLLPTERQGENEFIAMRKSSLLTGLMHNIILSLKQSSLTWGNEKLSFRVFRVAFKIWEGNFISNSW